MWMLIEDTPEELPLAVAKSCTELSKTTGKKRQALSACCIHGRRTRWGKGYAKVVKVEVNDEP